MAGRVLSRAVWPACRSRWLTLLATLGAGIPLGAQVPVSGPLEVYNAGSLAVPFNRLLRAFASRHPGVKPAQENSGSLAAARKLSELGKIPDVLAVADYNVIPELLVPRFATWYATFATNSMTLIYSGESAGAAEITGQNWYRVLQRPGVRWGFADPALDPAGYRTLMAFQLAEHHYRESGLAARLNAAADSRYMRGKSADLVALIQLGELDYAWTYTSLAKLHGLPFVALPPEVTLGDPALADWYKNATVRLPGATLAGRDSLDLRGAPIAYALTIPRDAPHPAVAAAFVAFIVSDDGRAILEGAALTPLERPVVGGPGVPPAGVRGLFVDDRAR
ncbi:MAG TPA: extracellular solute-binding protein [Gemmatimonadales bacterium]|nr:extracellular solute-binding protein [Gemmatimonadales bacterium]